MTLPSAAGGNEAVVLFRCNTGHGLEPVGEMGGALFYGPVLHGVGNDGGHGAVQPLAVLHSPLEGLVGLLGQTLPHDGVVEYHGTENFSDLAAHR